MPVSAFINLTLFPRFRSSIQFQWIAEQEFTIFGNDFKNVNLLSFRSCNKVWWYYNFQDI